MCFTVSGSQGSATYIVQEIADINAVQSNGRGLNLHIATAHINEVRSGSGVANDIEYKRLPCPVSGGIYLYYIQYNPEKTWQNAIYFTPINYRVQVKAIYVRHGEGIHLFFSFSFWNLPKTQFKKKAQPTATFTAFLAIGQIVIVTKGMAIKSHGNRKPA